jgi:hypothetical protein
MISLVSVYSAEVCLEDELVDLPRPGPTTKELPKINHSDISVESIG